MAIALALVLGGWYLNEKVLPEKVKPKIISELKKATSKEVTLGRIYLSHRGLVLKDLVFYKDANTPFIEIPDAAITVNPATLMAKKDLYFSITLTAGRDCAARIYSYGFYNLKEKSLNAVITTKDVECVTILKYLEKELSFSINDGRFNLTLKITLDKDKNLFSSANLYLKNAEINKEDIKVSGSAKVNFYTVKYTGKPFSYSGDAYIENVNIGGIPYINSIYRLIGDIVFAQKALTTSNLSGYVMGNKVYFRGTLEDFSNPSLKLLMNSEINLANKKELLPENIKNKIEKIDFTAGSASLNFLLNGNIRDRKNLYYALDIKLNDAELTCKGISEPFRAINGSLSLKKDFINCELKGNFNNKSYEFDAELNSFRQPDITAALNSEELHIETRCTLQDNTLSFSKFDGKIYKTSFRLIGEISDFSIPSFNMYGDIWLELPDLKRFFPKITDFYDRYNIRGNAKLTVFSKGEGASWKDWEIGLKVKSDEIGFLTFKVSDLYADLRLKDRQLNIPVFNLKPYDGLLFLRGNFDLITDNIPYYLDVDISGLELNKLVQDTQLNKKDISGFLSLKALINGNANDINVIKGKGWFKILNGNLWEVSFLKGLADILFMPDLKTIVFKEAFSNFEIANRKISTDDTLLTSDELTLLIRGFLDFSGNIDLTVTTSFEKNFVNKTVGEKIKSFVLDSLGRFMGEIHITGSLKEPKYTTNPIRLDKILKEKFKGFFGNILR